MAASRPCVAIIGSCGRSGPRDCLTHALFDAMVERAIETIYELCGCSPANVDLVSGGAAWADHIAVVLFERYDHQPHLRLCLPCELDRSNNIFVDIGGKRRTNPGWSANKYHAAFDIARGGLSARAEIVTALADTNATASVYRGFHARNSTIAATADWLIAFTWSSTGTPPKGGTRDTWTKFAATHNSSRMINIDLASLNPVDGDTSVPISNCNTSVTRKRVRGSHLERPQKRRCMERCFDQLANTVEVVKGSPTV